MIQVGRKLGSTEVIDALTDLFIMRGTPTYIRSNNGLEFIATTVKAWITALGAKPASIEQEAPGRTAMWKASTASSMTSL